MPPPIPFGNASYRSAPFAFSPAAAGALLLGLGARLWLFFRIPLISPDGFLYIQQAKALHFGYVDQLLSCHSYLSPYSISVSIAYPLMGDWVLAARSVNLLFSTLAIVPLYWLLRRFFNDALAATTLLIFALLPAYVLVGTDALRDPLFWLLGLTGIHLFVLHLENRRPWLLLVASVCMGLGAWARIEGLLFVLVSFGFLCFGQHRKRTMDIFIFLFPCALVLTVLLCLCLSGKLDAMALLNPERILALPRGVLSQYHHIRSSLQAIHSWDFPTISPYFFPRIRSLLWCIGIIALIVLMAETLLYVFFVFLLTGIISWARKIRTDRRLLYLAALSVLALVLLYFNMLYLWHSASRLLAVFLIPAFVFIGAGTEAFIGLLSRRLKVRTVTSYAIVLTLIFLSFVPKTIRANFDMDKLVFQEIGRFIAQRNTEHRVITICGTFKGVRMIHFYANLQTTLAPCFDPEAFFHRSDPGTLDGTLGKGMDYFIWSETQWGDVVPGRMPLNPVYQLRQIHTWSTEKLGDLVLYEVTK